MEPGNLQVVLMGIITVFVVLVCLIAIIKIMGAIMKSINSKNELAAATPAPTPVATQAPATGNNQQVVAAIAAAIAEDMGEDVSHIKIHSIKKV